MRPLRLIIVWSALVTAACGGSPTTPNSQDTNAGTSTGSTAGFAWQFNGTTWAAVGTPPSCGSFTVNLPVDLSQVTSILYPGQTRGDYKPHGGFRFDAPSQTTNEVTVRAPFSGMAFRGARYIASDEIQYTIDVIHPCGIMFRLGHLRDVAPRVQALEDTIPGTPDLDSHTTNFAPGSLFAEGDLIATAVGVRNTHNVFVDFGVYDLRQRNSSAGDPAWLAAHPGDVAPYAVCWFDWLTPGNTAAVRALPSADGVMGRTSDFCR